MSLATAQRRHVHEKHVAQSTNLFFEIVGEEFWRDTNRAIAELERYSANVELLLKEASEDMQTFIRDKRNNDEDLLTEHANRMRTAGATAVLLRDGIVPALKIDKNNFLFRLFALQSFGYLRAEVEATRNLML